MSATARKLRRSFLRNLALDASKARGCTCSPDIVVHGVERIEARHDDWCPLADLGRQYVIFNPPKGCDR